VAHGLADNLVVRIISCLVPIVDQRVPSQAGLPEVIWVAEQTWNATREAGSIVVAFNDASRKGFRSTAYMVAFTWKRMRYERRVDYRRVIDLP
jgi:hypothetical protein